MTNVRHCKFAAERGYLVTETKTISYQSNWRLGSQCTWDGMINGQIRGYKEWPEVFEIASDRVVCDMKLTSGSNLQYDDSIVLSLNDNVLAWGNLDISNVFDTVGNIYQYDLNKIIGASMQDESVGCVEGATECVMPSHDIPGNIKIAFSDELNEKIMLDVEAKGATFTLRAFGDNDAAVDCSHTGVNLDITYSYFVK